jgi:hypothetical protein
VQQGDEHRRHAAEHSDPVLLDRVEDRAHLEPWHEDQRGAAPDRGIHDAGEPEDVEQRQHGHADVVGAVAERVPGDRGRHVHLEVRELGALGPAGRAAGVDDHRGVVAVHLFDLVALPPVELVERPDPLHRGAVHRRAHDVDAGAVGLHGALGGLGREGVEGDQHPRPAVLQVVGHLGCLEQRVQGDDGQAGLERTETGEQAPHSVVRPGNYVPGCLRSVSRRASRPL